MNIKYVSSGNNVPKDINVIIEIPFNSSPVKYELDKKSGCLYVDRFISTTMFYPCNYGYINGTLALDGDPLDVLISTPYPILSKSIIRARAVGMLNMEDESGVDKKIIAFPHEKLSIEYSHIRDITDVSLLLLKQIEHFFLHYKDLEKEKWTKIIGWDGMVLAEKEIIDSINRYKRT